MKPGGIITDKTEGYEKIVSRLWNQATKGIKEVKPEIKVIKPKAPQKLKPLPEWADEIDKILAGRNLMRIPVDTKTDWLETIGKGAYMRIFRDIRTLPSPDEMADDLGMTENELLEKIKNRLRAPKVEAPEKAMKRFVSESQRKALWAKAPWIAKTWAHGLDWGRLTPARQAAIKMWVQQGRKGLPPEVLEQVEEFRFPMRKEKRIPEFEQKVKPEEVESPTRDFETMLNLKVNPERAFDKLVEITKDLGVKIKLVETGWARGKFSVTRDGKVIRGVAIKELNDYIALSHEIGHAIDFSVIGRELMEKRGEEILKYPLTLSERSGGGGPLGVSEKVLLAELKKVADYVRPFDRKKVKRGYLTYRNMKRELFADYMCCYLNDYEKALLLAPNFTEGLESAFPKVTDIREKYALPPEHTYPHDLPAKEIKGAWNMMFDRWKKFTPSADITIFKESQSNFNKMGQRMLNMVGLPFWRGQTHPQFGKIYRAVQDESIYNLNGELAKQEEILNLKELHGLPDISKNKITKAIYTGNDKGIQKYFNDGELKEMFALSDKEIKAYQRIVKVIKQAIENLVEARKLKYGFYKLSTERQEELEPIIKKQIEKLGGYFPIDRFGEWAVYARSDETPFFALREDQKDSIKLASRLAEMGYKQVSVYPVAKLPSEFYQNLKRFGWNDLENVAEAAGIDLETPDIKKLKEYLQTKIWDRHLIHRKYIPGYERTYDNMIRTVGAFINSSARKLYKAKSIYEANQALKGIDPRKEPETYALAKNYINDFFYTKPSEFYQVRKFIYLWYLSFKTSFFVQNLTQPLLTTMPEIANYVGGIKAPWYFSLGMKDAGKYLTARKLGKTPNLPAGDTELLDRAFRERLIGGMMTEMLMGIIHPRQQQVENIIGILGIASETLNRTHAATSALRIGHKQGITDSEELYSLIKSFIERTQFPYGSQNIPRFIAGAGSMKGIAKTMVIFKMFQLNYLHFLSQRIIKGSKGFGPKGWGIGMMALISGIIGLPFAGLIYWLWKKLTGIDIRGKLRKKLGETKGWLADVILHGVPTLWNMNLTYLIGLGDIISPSYDPMGQVLGAGYGIIDKISWGYEQWQKGEYAKAIANFSPVAIRNIITALEWKKEGKSFKKDVYVKPSTWEIIQKTLGFTPNRVAKQYEIRDIERSFQNRYNKLKSRIEIDVKKKLKTEQGNELTKRAVVHKDIEALEKLLGKDLLEEIENLNKDAEETLFVLYTTAETEVLLETYEATVKKYQVSPTDVLRWISEIKKEEWMLKEL